MSDMFCRCCLPAPSGALSLTAICMLSISSTLWLLINSCRGSLKLSHSTVSSLTLIISHCSVIDIQCCQNILYLKYYTLFCQSLKIILYSYFFQSNTLKILYYRIKLSKRIKSTLFILFSLKISDTCLQFINQLAYQKKNLLVPSAIS